MTSWTLFRIRGVPIRIHFTLLIAIPYFALMIASQFQPMTELASIDANDVRLPALVWGVLLSLGLFVSVGLHELAHSLWALRSGRRVQGITLMLLGGVSEIEGEGRAEASIAFLGPLMSFTLGLFFYSLYQNVTAVPDLGFCFFYLAQLNLTIAAFNLLPAFPLDGGRLLRALLAKRMSSVRATEIAVTIGKGFAIMFGVVGLLSFNFILVLIALFVYAGGAQELQLLKMRRVLVGATAEEFMLPVLRSVSASTPVDQVLTELLDRKELWVSVTHSSGRFLGVAEFRELLSIAEDRRSSIPVGMVVRDETPQVDRQAPGEKILDQMLRDGPYIAVVSPDGLLLGMIDQDRLMRAIRQKQMTDDKGERRAA